MIHPKDLSEEQVRDYIRSLKQAEHASPSTTPSFDLDFANLQDHYRSGDHDKDLKKVFGE